MPNATPRFGVSWLTSAYASPGSGRASGTHLLACPLKVAGIKMGRDGLFDVLRRARLLVAPRRAYHKTTDSHHRFYRHPNLLKEDPEQIVPTGSEQVWVADITYLPTTERVAYLSLVTDAYSRKIVGYHVHDTLQAESVSQAFRMALKTRRSTSGQSDGAPSERIASRPVTCFCRPVGRPIQTSK